MASADVFFYVRNSYYTGAFQQCINEAQNIKVKSEDDILTKDTFLYRAYIALNKPSIPLSEIDALSAPLPLKSIRRFADYTANVSKRKAIAEEVIKEFENSLLPNDDISLLMNSFILLHEEDFENALKILSQGQSLEFQAATIQCLLKINRVDLAVKELKKMQEIDEDSTISQLALSWVNMAAGKDKLKDAFYIYQELIDKYGATNFLLVSQSTCLIQQQKYEEAEKLLQDAQQRDANNPNILIGLVVVSQFLGKQFEVTNRYINQLKSDFPDHIWTKDYVEKEKEFDKLTLSEL